MHFISLVMHIFSPTFYVFNSVRMHGKRIYYNKKVMNLVGLPQWFIYCPPNKKNGRSQECIVGGRSVATIEVANEK